MASSVSKIFQHLKSNTRFRKGGIHLSWPSPPVIPRSQQFPLKVPNIINPLDHRLSLLESTYYLFAPNKRGGEHQRPWIARVEEVDATTWRLLNPLSGICDVVEPDPPVMGMLKDPSNYLVKELARSYTLVDDHDKERVHRKVEASKVIPLSNAKTTSMNEEEEMTLLAMDWDGKLALWKQGDEKWNHILSDNVNNFSNIVSCGGKFYAVDRLGSLFEIDPTMCIKDHNFVKIISIPKIVPSSEYKHDDHLWMAEYNGQVHMLVKDDPNDFDSVIRLYVLEDEDGTKPHRLDIVKSLNNHVLFILNEVSFCLPVELLNRNFEGDWVCFAHDNFFCRYGYSGCVAGIVGISDYDIDHYKGIQALEDFGYFCYHDYLSKCNLRFEEGFCNVEGFHFDLPQDEYVTLLFPTPPWIDYYCLDADKGFPSVQFDKCYFPKYDLNGY